MRLKRLWIAAATTAFVAAAGSVGAAEKKKGGDIREMIEPPSHVQMQPISAPVTLKDPGTAPITVYLGAVNKYEVGEICRRAPIINDAIMRELYADPIPVKNRMLMVDGLGIRLIGPINQALGKHMIKEVHVFAGAQGSASGGVVSKLPFGSSSGCTGIKDMMDRLEGKEAKKQSGGGKK